MLKEIHSDKFGTIRAVLTKENEMWYCLREVSHALGTKRSEQWAKNRDLAVRYYNNGKRGRNMVLVDMEGVCAVVDSSTNKSSWEFLQWIRQEETQATSALTDTETSTPVGEDLTTEENDAALLDSIKMKEEKAEQVGQWLRRLTSTLQQCTERGMVYKKAYKALKAKVWKLEQEAKPKMLDGKCLKELLGEYALRFYNIQLSMKGKEQIRTTAYFTPTQIIELAYDAEVLHEKMSATSLNELLIKWNFQETDKNKKDNYIVSPMLGDEYAQVFSVVKNGFEFAHLQWSYKGLTLILGALLCYQRCNNQSLFE